MNLRQSLLAKWRFYHCEIWNVKNIFGNQRDQKPNYRFKEMYKVREMVYATARNNEIRCIYEFATLFSSRTVDSSIHHRGISQIKKFDNERN